MIIEEVRKMKNPVDRFMYFVQERESIRLKKEAGEPAPWTDDEILQAYRFCNVRRMDDKVSKWLLKNWYEPYFDHPNMLVAVAFARFFNLPSTLEVITPYVFCNGLYGPSQARRIKEVLRERRDKGGENIFNGAYVVRGNDGEDKIASVVDYYVKSLDEDNRIDPTIVSDSMQETWGGIVRCFGFGSFMAGQLVADLRWAVSGTWGDRSTWAPIGPGSKKGMNLYQGRPPTAKLKQAQFLTELTAVFEQLKQRLPEIASRLELHDVQNCFCEFSKSEKCLAGGRAKQNYPGEAS